MGTIINSMDKEPQWRAIGSLVEVYGEDGHLVDIGMIIGSRTERTIVGDPSEIGITFPKVEIQTIYTIRPVDQESDFTGEPDIEVNHDLVFML